MPGWGEMHTPAGPPTGRQLLEDLGPALQLARSLRYEKSTAFENVTDDELERAARALRAISYSCTEGARLLDTVRSRRGDQVTGPSPEGCPAKCNDGYIERTATPEEVDAGHELGVAFDPCPECS